MSPAPGWLRRAAAELIGTYAMVVAAAGAIVVNTLTGQLGHLGNALTAGLVILVMVAACGHISGAHFNPGGDRRLRAHAALPLAGGSDLRGRTTARRGVGRGHACQAAVRAGGATWARTCRAPTIPGVGEFEIVFVPHMLPCLVITSASDRYPRGRRYGGGGHRRDRGAGLDLWRAHQRSVDEPGARVRGRRWSRANGCTIGCTGLGRWWARSLGAGFVSVGEGSTWGRP